MGEQEGASASISPELSAILDAQRNAILTAVNTQIQSLQTNLLKALSDLAAQIASDLQPDNYVFKKKGKVVKTSNSALKALESGNVPNTKEELNREENGAFCARQGGPKKFKTMIMFPEDVFKSKMWREFYFSIPDYLQPLASRVQESVLASEADGTYYLPRYLAGFKRWKHWASSNCFIHMPANSFHVAVYLQCLILDANSPSPVLNTVYSWPVCRTSQYIP
ncbi:hypothetical protein ACROYT_G040442 [Oculina patagonica]